MNEKEVKARVIPPWLQSVGVSVGSQSGEDCAGGGDPGVAAIS
jgi:hypothetical protein